MKWFLLFVVALVPASADACVKCGNYRSCAYIKPYVAPVYHQDKTNVFVVQNSYPAPLVGAGATHVVSNGGYQNAVLPFFDPNRYLSQRMELRKAEQATAALETNQADGLAQKFAELQAPAVEHLAKGEAGERLLRAAGLSSAEFKEGHSQAVVVSRDSYGRLTVVPLNASETSNVNKTIDGERAESVGDALTLDAQAVLDRNRCVRCHKGPGSEGGDKDFSDVSKLDAVTKYRIELFVRKNRMPPPGDGQPVVDEDKAILEDWVSTVK